MNRSDGTKEYLDERYERFYTNFLEGEDEVKIKYRERIFGPGHDLIFGVPLKFMEVSQNLEFAHIPNWIALDIKTKAVYIAAKRIENMREILNRHLEIQTLERERLEQNAASKNKSKKNP